MTGKKTFLSVLCGLFCTAATAQDTFKPPATPATGLAAAIDTAALRQRLMTAGLHDVVIRAHDSAIVVNGIYDRGDRVITTQEIFVVTAKGDTAYGVDMMSFDIFPQGTQKVYRVQDTGDTLSSNGEVNFMLDAATRHYRTVPLTGRAVEGVPPVQYNIAAAKPTLLPKAVAAAIRAPHLGPTPRREAATTKNHL